MREYGESSIYLPFLFPFSLENHAELDYVSGWLRRTASLVTQGTAQSRFLRPRRATNLRQPSETPSKNLSGTLPEGC